MLLKIRSDVKQTYDRIESNGLPLAIFKRYDLPVKKMPIYHYKASPVYAALHFKAIRNL